ncbi:hypothetical protein HMPREF1028_02537, partial [Neisseria sp. GT4A_CT1]
MLHLKSESKDPLTEQYSGLTLNQDK